MGFKTLVTQIDQAVKGSGKGSESFKKLGINVKDVNGNVKDQETIFNETVIALQNMEEGTEKAKLANDLFGRSGAEMMPMLNGAAGSVEELRQNAHNLGIILSDESIDASVLFGDTLDDLKNVFGGIGTKIGMYFLPLLQKMADWIIEHMPEIQAVAETVFNKIGDAVQWVMDNANWLIPVLGGLLAAFIAFKIVGVINYFIYCIYSDSS